MDIYAEFNYYSDVYLGSEVNENEFSRYAESASRWIDRFITKEDFEINEQIKMAVCAVCDVLKKYEGRAGIQREDNDGYSISYDCNAQSMEMRIYNAIRLYADDELFYRGLL